MKKILIFILFALLLLCSGCNKQLFDTTYKFDYAYILLPNGSVVQGEVESWRDFEDGDQLQVKINGDVYLTHATNVVLIDKKEE